VRSSADDSSSKGTKKIRTESGRSMELGKAGKGIYKKWVAGGGRLAGWQGGRLARRAWLGV
jgi:hypothetical protein